MPCHQHPLTLIKSRAVMSAISKDNIQLHKYRIFDSVRDRIFLDIEKKISGKGLTKLIVPGSIINGILTSYGHSSLCQNGWFSESFQNEFIDFLKTEFPECSVEYIETKGYDNKVVERLFVVDWSISAED